MADLRLERPDLPSHPHTGHRSVWWSAGDPQTQMQMRRWHRRRLTASVDDLQLTEVTDPAGQGTTRGRPLAIPSLPESPFSQFVHPLLDPRRTGPPTPSLLDGDSMDSEENLGAPFPRLLK